MRAAAFFDRDGTINVNFGHVYRPEDLVFVPGVPEIIKGHNDTGTPVIVVSNQAGIAKGMYTERDMCRFNAYMNEQLRERYGAQRESFRQTEPHGGKVCGTGYGRKDRDDPGRRKRGDRSGIHDH